MLPGPSLVANWQRIGRTSRQARTRPGLRLAATAGHPGAQRHSAASGRTMTVKVLMRSCSSSSSRSTPRSMALADPRLEDQPGTAAACWTGRNQPVGMAELLARRLDARSAAATALLPTTGSPVAGLRMTTSGVSSRAAAPWSWAREAVMKRSAARSCARSYGPRIRPPARRRWAAMAPTRRSPGYATPAAAQPCIREPRRTAVRERSNVMACDVCVSAWAATRTDGRGVIWVNAVRSYMRVHGRPATATRLSQHVCPADRRRRPWSRGLIGDQNGGYLRAAPGGVVWCGSAKKAHVLSCGASASNTGVMSSSRKPPDWCCHSRA